MSWRASENLWRDRCDVRNLVGVATIIARLPIIARTSTLTRVALSWSTSWALVGFGIMALGWLHLFYAAVFFAIGLVAGGIATVIWVRTLARRPPPRWRPSISGLSRSDFAVAAVGLLAVAAAAIGAIRRPNRRGREELQVGGPSSLGACAPLRRGHLPAVERFQPRRVPVGPGCNISCARRCPARRSCGAGRDRAVCGGIGEYGGSSTWMVGGCRGRLDTAGGDRRDDGGK